MICEVWFYALKVTAGVVGCVRTDLSDCINEISLNIRVYGKFMAITAVFTDLSSTTLHSKSTTFLLCFTTATLYHSAHYDITARYPLVDLWISMYGLFSFSYSIQNK